jgi:glutathione synthase/RimK-type ligase-like ATP-grasp enzyme
LLGIWWRRVIPPALPHFDPRLREYCQTEYRRFYDNLEFFLPQITWVSRPSAIARAKNKGLQLLLAKDLGFTILHSMFTNNPRQATDWLIAEKIIYKAIDNPRVPLEEGKISTVFTTELSEGDAESCKGLLSCPGILQQYSPKAADIRVTVINNTVFAVLIDSQRKPTTKLDFRTGSRDLKHEIHSLPYDIEEKCRKLVARLGLKFGAIDLALLDDGSYVFFEINANGQWGWLEQKTNLPMRKTLLDYLFVSPA